MSVFDMIIAIRESLAKSGARVDMTTATAGYGLPTVNSFWRKYTARSPASFNRPEVEQGGKIILPVSAIEELTRELDTQSDSLGFEGYPSHFSHLCLQRGAHSSGLQWPCLSEAERQPKEGEHHHLRGHWSGEETTLLWST